MKPASEGRRRNGGMAADRDSTEGRIERPSGEWILDNGGGIGIDGKKCWSSNGPIYASYPPDEQPTHWMPLPDPPTDLPQAVGGAVMANKPIIRKWVDALRSGKYEQGNDLLRSIDDEFCCLGVLCDVLGMSWRKDCEDDDSYTVGRDRGGAGDEDLPPSAVKRAGLPGSNPHVRIGTRRRSLGVFNDTGRTFPPDSRRHRARVADMTADRITILEAQDCKCPLCHNVISHYENFEIDHEWARGLGGPDTDDNRRAVHYACHKRKTASDVGKIAKVSRKRRQAGRSRPRHANPHPRAQRQGTQIRSVAGAPPRAAGTTSGIGGTNEPKRRHCCT